LFSFQFPSINEQRKGIRNTKPEGRKAMENETTKLLEQLAKLMGVQIDAQVLRLAAALCDEGVDPAQLAKAIKDIQKELQL
jgi:hypothetical protein